MTEWNLSDKRVGDREDNEYTLYFYEEKDVQEFIRRLKESWDEFDERWMTNELSFDEATVLFKREIDKLAGEKLI